MRHTTIRAMDGRRIRGIAVAAALAATAFTVPAAADDTATALLRRGLELRREHRDEEALSAFVAANAIAPTPTSRAQIALAEQALGRWLDAERDLVAARGAYDHPWIARHRAALDGAASTIASHLAWLTLTTAVPATSAALDGRPIAIGEETRVLAGTAELTVSAVGATALSQVVTLAPGTHTSIFLPAAPGSPADTPPRDDDASDADTAIGNPTVAHLPAPGPAVHTGGDGAARAARRLALRFGPGPVALVGAGAVALGLGTYWAVHAMHEKSELDAACEGRARCDPSALTRYSDGRASANAATVAFGAGLAAIAAGVVWSALGGGEARVPRAASGLAVWVGPQRGGIVLRGEL